MQTIHLANVFRMHACLISWAIVVAAGCSSSPIEEPIGNGQRQEIQKSAKDTLEQSAAAAVGPVGEGIPDHRNASQSSPAKGDANKGSERDDDQADFTPIKKRLDALYPKMLSLQDMRACMCNYDEPCLDSAIESLSKTIREDANDKLSHFLRGEMRRVRRLRMGAAATDADREDFTAALAIDADYAPAVQGLKQLQREAALPTESAPAQLEYLLTVTLPALNAWVQQVPNEKAPYYCRSLAYRAVDNWHEAFLDVTRAIIVAPVDADLRLVRTVIATNLGQLDIAVEDAEVAAGAKPELAMHAHIERGRALNRWKRNEDAIQALQAAKSLATGRNEAKSILYEIISGLGAAYVGVNDYKAAEEHFKRAAELDVQGELQLVNYFLNTNRYDDAMAACDRYLKAKAGDEKALRAGNLDRINLHYARGEFDKVIADIGALLPAIPPPVRANWHVLRGQALVKKNQYEPAIRDFTDAIALDVNCWRAYMGRGKAYELQGDVPQAAVDYIEGVQMQFDAFPWDHLQSCVDLLEIRKEEILKQVRGAKPSANIVLAALFLTIDDPPNYAELIRQSSYDHRVWRTFARLGERFDGNRKSDKLRIEFACKALEMEPRSWLAQHVLTQCVLSARGGRLNSNVGLFHATQSYRRSGGNMSCYWTLCEAYHRAGNSDRAINLNRILVHMNRNRPKTDLNAEESRLRTLEEHRHIVPWDDAVW